MRLGEGNLFLFLMEYKIRTDEKQSTFRYDFCDFGEYLSSLVFIIKVHTSKSGLSSEVKLQLQISSPNEFLQRFQRAFVLYSFLISTFPYLQGKFINSRDSYEGGFFNFFALTFSKKCRSTQDISFCYVHLSAITHFSLECPLNSTLFSILNMSEAV